MIEQNSNPQKAKPGGGNQSGSPGQGAAAGNESTSGQPGSLGDEPADIPGGEELAVEARADDVAEIQQSVEREGMGQHRHRGRGRDQALDATADVDELGSQQSGAAKTGDGGPRR
ncbi:MAG: hypothetical protein ABWY27_13150 [Telluria sp.]